jgi:hypothetical protein
MYYLCFLLAEFSPIGLPTAIFSNLRQFNFSVIRRANPHAFLAHFNLPFLLFLKALHAIFNLHKELFKSFEVTADDHIEQKHRFH